MMAANPNEAPSGQVRAAGALSAAARVYVAFVLSVGVGVFAFAACNFTPASTARFLAYLACAAASSLLKVHLPGVTGTMSVNFLFILQAIADCSPGEVVVVAIGGIVVQYVCNSRKSLQLSQLAFNLAASATAALAGWRAYHFDLLTSLGADGAVVLALAACAYFTVNTLSVALILAITEKKPVADVWRNCFFWSFPFYLVGAAVVELLQMLSGFVGWQRAALILPVVYTIHRSYRLYLERLDHQKQHAEEMAGLHLRTIEALALAIEAKDHTTNEHLHRVQTYAKEIGIELGLSRIELDALEAAALLHDIGKLAVPEHIISKPGRLTPDEFDKMKIHPIVGAEILERVKFPYPVVPIVAAHHEKWDGSGYPHGLKGEEIPVGARILSAVDCLDALASDRQYRSALPLEAAMEMIRKQAGTAFDPRVVHVLERRYRELERLARSKGTETMRLSTDVKVAPGVAPAAGYADDEALPRAPGVPQGQDCLSLIAAARHEVQALFEVAQVVGSSLSLSQTLSVVAQRIQPMVPHDTFVLYLTRNDRLQTEYTSGIAAETFASLSIPLGEGLSGWVAENGKTVLNGNPSVETGYLKDPTKVIPLRSAVVVPLQGASSTIGAVALYSRDAHAYSRDHLRILVAASAKLGLSIENTLRFLQAESTAATDFVTGLSNGRSFFLRLQDEVAHCSARGEELALLVCDVDGFKQINDEFGHMEGDRILRLIAMTLRQNCRATDYIARIGGDEFALLLSHADESTVQELIRRINAAVARLAYEEFGSHRFSISIGCARLGEKLKEPEELLSEADRMMYKVKRARTHHRSSLSQTSVIPPNTLRVYNAAVQTSVRPS
jgi:diguanylate cyclase (GGDEF)-like protein/putative nucleotidyltransferase with HDIG domain